MGCNKLAAHKKAAAVVDVVSAVTSVNVAATVIVIVGLSVYDCAHCRQFDLGESWFRNASFNA